MSEIRITPASPPDVGQVTFRSIPNPEFAMPPALVEDAEATAAQKSENQAVNDFIWSLIPGASPLDAYDEYKKGNYTRAAEYGLSGMLDLVPLGKLAKAKGALKLLVPYMRSRVRDAVVDAVANQAGDAVAERYGSEAGFVTQEIVSGILSRRTSRQNKTQIDKAQIGFADGGGKNRHVPTPFQAAEKGGRHAGFLKNRLGRSSDSLFSEAKTLRQRAAEHQIKIDKRIGFGKVSDVPLIQSRADAGRIKHLEKEIQNFQEQAEIVEELARRAVGGGL